MTPELQGSQRAQRDQREGRFHMNAEAWQSDWRRGRRMAVLMDWTEALSPQHSSHSAHLDSTQHSSLSRARLPAARG